MRVFLRLALASSLFLAGPLWAKQDREATPLPAPVAECQRVLEKQPAKIDRSNVRAFVDNIKNENLAGLDSRSLINLINLKFPEVVSTNLSRAFTPDSSAALAESSVRPATLADIAQIEAIADTLQMKPGETGDRGFLSSRITTDELKEIIKDGLSFVYEDESGIQGFTLMFSCKSEYGRWKSGWLEKASYVPGIEVNTIIKPVIARAIATRAGAPIGIGHKMRTYIAQWLAAHGGATVIGKISLFPLNDTSMKVHLKDGFSIIGNYVDDHLQSWAIVAKPAGF